MLLCHACNFRIPAPGVRTSESTASPVDRGALMLFRCPSPPYVEFAPLFYSLCQAVFRVTAENKKLAEEPRWHLCNFQLCAPMFQDKARLAGENQRLVEEP